MKIQFTPTAGMQIYRGQWRGAPEHADCEALAAGVYDWPEPKCLQLLADFPENFSVVSDEARTRGAPEPTHNRAHQGPGRNR